VLRWSSFRWPVEHFHHDIFAVRDNDFRETAVAFTLGSSGRVAAMKVAEPLGVGFQ
jgi:hypothetical protein